MSQPLPFIVLATMVYLARVAGLSFSDRLRVPRFWEEFLELIPVAALAALVMPGIGFSDGAAWIKLCALGVAGLMALRTRQLGLSVLLGLLTAWLLQLLS